jgi:hypothetical protein
MSSRVAGASLALIAAAVLAVSVATPAVLPGELALFAGHPTVDGHTRTRQEVHVGLYGAQVCNPGGDDTCTSHVPASTFRITALSTLGATAFLIMAAVILAILTLRKSEARHGAGKLVRFLSLIAIAGVGVLIFLEPAPKGTVPIGFGMGLFGGGVAAALLASVIALRPPPPIKLRVAERGSHAVPVMRSLPTQRSGPVQRPLPTSQPARFDDRRADPGPEPWASRDARAVPPSSADFTDSSEPFAHPLANADNAVSSPVPQLRPLYEASPQQGGTGGLLPIERPAMPSRPPTPVSRSVLNEVAGLPTAPPPPAERSKPKTLPPPTFGARAQPPSVPPPPDARRKPPSVPPPFDVRAKPPSVPPPPDAPHVAGPPIVPPSLAPSPIAASPAPSPPSPPSPPSIDTPHVAMTPIGPPHVATPPIAPPPFTAPVTGPSVNAPPMVVLPPGSAPRTQISLVPPMPENDPPIAPPTAQVVSSRTASPPDAPNLFSRPETPLAPPPSPPAAPPQSRRDRPSQPRSQRESQPPRPGRESQPPRPGRASQASLQPPRDPSSPRAMRAAVPMPDRSGRSAPEPRPSQPPPSVRPPSPRPTISTPVVPPPAFASPIPAIPPIPAVPAVPDLPRLPETEVTATDPTDRVADDSDLDHPTIARVPIEITENNSNTTVSPAMPVPEDLDAAEDTIAPPGSRPMTTTLAGAVPPVPLVRDRSKLPVTTAPTSLPPPRDSRQSSGPSPACPQCESPMAWVEEHLRFYCKSCRMYF